MKRSWEGIVLKAMGAKDFTLEVIGQEQISPDFLRINVKDGGLLMDTELHPTMWIRLWFDDGGKGHQRAYTLVDPDVRAGTFSMDFAMHAGIAADWARRVQPGATIEATVQGSAFNFPQPARRLLIVGDPASIPAINSLLDARSDVGSTAPAHLWLEFQHDADPSLEVRTSPGDAVTWIPRKRDGAALAEEVCSSLTAETVSPEEDFFWVACEASQARAIAKHLRKVVGVERRRIDVLGYWKA